MPAQSAFARLALQTVVFAACPLITLPLAAQAPPAAATTEGSTASTVRAVGTVKSVGGGAMSVSTDKGDSASVTLPANVRVLQLAPGSTDLKTAQAATVTDISQGDRVLVTGRPADGGSITALRVILMKSSAIAQNNASRQQDWQRRGSGGVVTAVDPSSGTLSVTAGARKETITTTAATTFRRYAPGSVKFEDASLSKLSDIQPGDQVRVRGDKSADGATIAADEVVSGAFRNIAGLVTRVDASGNTVTVNDLVTKKPVTITLSSDSDLRSLPPEMAARFAARSRGGAAGAGAASAGPGASGPGASGPGASGSSAAGAGAPGGRPPYAAGGAAAGPGNGSGERPAGYPGGRGAGGDLSQVISRLPKASVADLKAGEAVMVVASGNSNAMTAITLLTGVEPLLAASPQGGANGFSISPWNLGGGGGEGGGEGSGPQ